ncbi:MAG: hypothetical protein LBN98_05555 [Prevotellaceae bacterium]|jgi:hypothetical protein|nr:hypothetical protein [Prevotellaceae bacterium]
MKKNKNLVMNEDKISDLTVKKRGRIAVRNSNSCLFYDEQKDNSTNSYAKYKLYRKIKNKKRVIFGRTRKEAFTKNFNLLSQNIKIEKTTYQ